MAIVTTAITGILSHQANSGGTISGDTGEYMPLVDRILKNKFQLYNRSCQKLTSDIKSKTGLKPLQMFIDSKQDNKKFVLGGFSYKPCSDVITVNLFEYDNTSEINLTDVTVTTA